jgi:hypothetical protein
MDVDKAPFICDRLGLVVLPAMVVSSNQEMVDKIQGFDVFGGNDAFGVEVVEERLLRVGALFPAAPRSTQEGVKPASTKRNVQGNVLVEDDSDGEW